MHDPQLVVCEYRCRTANGREGEHGSSEVGFFDGSTQQTEDYPEYEIGNQDRCACQGRNDDPETDQVDEYGEANDAQLGFFIGHGAERVMGAGEKLAGGFRKGNAKSAPGLNETRG